MNYNLLSKKFFYYKKDTSKKQLLIVPNTQFFPSRKFQRDSSFSYPLYVCHQDLKYSDLQSPLVFLFTLSGSPHSLGSYFTPVSQKQSIAIVNTSLFLFLPTHCKVLLWGVATCLTGHFLAMHSPPTAAVCLYPVLKSVAIS